MSSPEDKARALMERLSQPHDYTAPPLKETPDRRFDCALGQHVEQPGAQVHLAARIPGPEDFGVEDRPVRLCRHCRCLYVG